MKTNKGRKALLPGCWLLAGYALDCSMGDLRAPMDEGAAYLLMGHDPGFYSTYYGISYMSRRPANEDWRPAP